MGQPILRDRETPFGSGQFSPFGVDCPAYRKGTGLIFPGQDVDTCGNTNELGDASEYPGKSSLFFLTDLTAPWNRFSRR